MGAQELWNREELYEEVWSTPMKTLAHKYGISDVGLAKVCRKLVIPLPGRGYWARKEAGQKVEQEALPAMKEKIVLWKPQPRPPAPKLSELGSKEELAQIEQLEKMVGEIPLHRGALSHQLIAQARLALSDAHTDDRKILWTRQAMVDIRVSNGSLDRALRIMATVVQAIEGAGFSVAVTGGERGHTIAKIHGQEIRFGLVEKVERIEIAAPPKGGLLDRVLTFAGKPVTLEPSGKLSIRVWNGWGSNRTSWKDGKQRLEEQLPRVVAGFIRLALHDRAEEQKRAAEKREQERRGEEHARLLEAVKSERVRARALRHAAANWSRAEQIRSFISSAQAAAVQDGQSIEPDSPFGMWVSWAEQQADRLDPLKESPPSIIDHRPEEPIYASYYGYRKPDPPFRFPKPIWRVK